MNQPGLLDHILGDYSDKLKVISQVSQPLLTEMINDLSQLSYNKHDGKNLIQAIDLWEASLINPNLSEENLKTIFPLVFRVENYSVRQHNPIIPDSKTRSEQICQNLKSLKFNEAVWLFLFTNLLTNPAIFSKPVKLLNKKTKDLMINLSKEESYPNLDIFFKQNKEQLLSKIPSITLLQCCKNFNRTLYLDQYYIFNATQNDIKQEIKKRKKPTPKKWRNYKTTDFTSFFHDLKTLIFQAKIDRKNFFKILKNRLLTKEDIIKENEKYFELLSKMEESIKKEKTSILNKLSEIKADSTPEND